MDSKKLRLEIRTALKKMLSESKTLFVNDGASDLFDNVNDIAMYVLRFMKDHMPEMMEKYDISFGDLKADGGSELTSTGILNFYYKQINITDENDLKQILGLIKYALSEANIKYGEFSNEGNRVVRIPILKNENEKTAPHAQFSNGMFDLVFNQLLGMEINDETGLIPVRDLVMKIKQVEPRLGEYFDESPTQQRGDGGVTIITPTVSTIAAQLNKIKQVLNWAITNKFETVYFG